MSLTYPDKKVAIDIVDDPAGSRFDGDEQEWTVVRCTCAQLEDYASFKQIMDRVSDLLSAGVGGGAEAEVTPAVAPVVVG